MSAQREGATPVGLSRGRAWGLALVATLTMAVSYVDRQALAAIAPTVSKVFDISETQYGFLISAFSLAYLFCSPIAGLFIDKIGARRGLLGAVFLWSIVAASHALVPSFAVLFGLRLLLGLAESPSFPGAAQTVQRALPVSERARGFGVLFTGSSLGAMVAGPLATAIEKHWGFRAAFLGTAIVGLAWVPLWLMVAWRGPAREVLDRRADGGSSSGARVSPFAALSHPAVLRGSLAVLATAPALGFMFNWPAKFLVTAHHLTQSEVGPYLIVPPLFFDVGSVLFGHLASVRARSLPKGAPDRALFGVAVVLALAFAAVPFGRTPLESMILGGVAVAGGGGVFSLITSDMLARVPSSVVGSASSIGAAAQSVAYIATAPLLGMLIKASGGYTAPFVALGVWVLPGCIGWLLWKPPAPVSEQG